MTRPRSALVSLEETPYYHCISRCVRRAFLCGQDRFTGKSFNHRKPWLVKRFRLLSGVFAIDIAAYAVMSNHYHLVLHVDQHRSQQWSDDEVIDRWLMLYKGPVLVQRFKKGEPLLPAEMSKMLEIVHTWRDRLSSISWFMACLNEYIARKANAEDNCKGRFWEGRFVSKALLDETALLSTMAYVDLNPVRAGIAHNLKESSFTSIQDRIKEVAGQSLNHKPPLMAFSESKTHDEKVTTLPFHLKDYIELVDWTGRIVRKKKRGFIAAEEPKILKALRLTTQDWEYLSLAIQKRSINTIHGLERLKAHNNQQSKTLAA
ncbi:MAG: transposase [Pseudohongiellaceae bacterium]